MAYRNKLRPRAYGPTRPPNEDELRGSGRTTARALKYLGMAIENPGKPVRVLDHHMERRAHACLLALMEDTAKKLDLVGLTFNRGGDELTVRFDVLEWVD